MAATLLLHKSESCLTAAASQTLVCGFIPKCFTAQMFRIQCLSSHSLATASPWPVVTAATTTLLFTAVFTWPLVPANCTWPLIAADCTFPLFLADCRIFPPSATFSTKIPKQIFLVLGKGQGVRGKGPPFLFTWPILATPRAQMALSAAATRELAAVAWDGLAAACCQFNFAFRISSMKSGNTKSVAKHRTNKSVMICLISTTQQNI